MKKKYWIPFRNKLSTGLYFLVITFTTVLFNSCEKDDIINVELSNEVQLLKSYLKENGKSSFYSQIEWENEITEYKIDKNRVIYIPVNTTDPKRNIFLKGIIDPSGKIQAFYSSYTRNILSENSQSENFLYIIYGINGGVVNASQIVSHNDFFRYSTLDVSKLKPNSNGQNKNVLRFTYNFVTDEFEENNDQNFKKTIEVIVSFSELDIDMNGQISVDEAEVYPGLSCHFASTDMNGDGQLSEIEYASYSSSPSGCNIQLQEVIIDNSVDYTDSGYTVYWVLLFDDGDSSNGGNTGGGSPGGSSGSNDWNSEVFVYENISGEIIEDVQDYLKCFDNTKGAEVTFYADQPIPNSSDAWDGNISNPDVGHSFISIQQGNITRVLGFYPSEGVNPFNPAVPHVIVNDESKHYDVSLTVPIGSANLENLLNFLSNLTVNYDLNDYNCTDYSIMASREIGVNLPDSYNTWFNGGGNNPGTLGENIRNSSSLPGNKDLHGGNAPNNLGNCE